MSGTKIRVAGPYTGVSNMLFVRFCNFMHSHILANCNNCNFYCPPRFFMIGYLGIGFEFAAELTYPVPEGTSSGVLNVSSEIFGIIFTVIGGEILNTHGDMAMILTLVGLLVVGLAMTMLINGTDLRRQATKAGLKEQMTCTNISGFIPNVMHNSVLFPTGVSSLPS
jgi:hypothetical protein